MRLSILVLDQKNYLECAMLPDGVDFHVLFLVQGDLLSGINFPKYFSTEPSVITSFVVFKVSENLQAEEEEELKVERDLDEYATLK